MNIMMMKRGVYNAVSFQAKCRSTRFYSSSSLGANERWKEDLRSELDSFQYHYQYQSEHYMFGTLMSTSSWCFNSRHKYKEYESEPFSSESSRYLYDWYTLPEKGKEMIQTVYSPALFMPGYRAIGKYVDGDGVMASQVPAFNALERFWKQKDQHEKALTHLSKDLTKTQTTILVVNHLLTQLLSIPTNYFIDITLKGEDSSCPCGCQTLVQYGETSLGANGLFSGNVDIALFPSHNSVIYQDDASSTVVSLASKRKDTNLKLEKNWAEDNESDEEGALTSECEEDEHFSERNKLRQQIIKQAITMSLCKRNIVQYHLEKGLDIDYMYLSDASFVPVLGIDKTSFVVALYDSEYDYLLLTPNCVEILDHSTWQLSPKAIIHLWMIIHHNQFCGKPPPRLLDQFKGTCGLEEQVGGAHRLEEALRNSYWTYMPRRDLCFRRKAPQKMNFTRFDPRLHDAFYEDDKKKPTKLDNNN